MSKKKPAPSPAKLNDKNYLASGRARHLPIYKCLVNVGWQENGMADVMVMRKHANGHLTTGIYLVDTFCTGVKSTYFLFNMPEHELEERMARAPYPLEEITYELAHNIIYGAITYAREYGIEPDPDFRLTQMILEEDTEDIELIELEFGKNGKPLLAINPAGDPRADYYIRQLENNAAPGEYAIVDGRLLDEISDKELMDAFYQYPEIWIEKDWEEFIDDTEPIELEDFPDVAGYMFEKIVAKPTEAMELLTSETEQEGMKITYDALPNRYTEEEKKESLAVLNLINTPDLTEQDKLELLERVKKDMAQWPENRVLAGYLILVYNLLGDNENMQKARTQLYEKFPDYLIGKVQYAEQLIERGKVEDVPAVFNGAYNLKALYPDRDTFHVSELMIFNTVMCHYFLEKGDLNMANIYYTMILKLKLPEQMALNESLFLKLDAAIVEEMEPVLEEARESESKKRELIAKLMN